MEETAPKRGSGTSKIYEQLKADILNMTLAPGEPLDETGLSNRFGMSRTPVREALLKLVAEGLATTLPNRNTVVTALDFKGLPHYLDALTLMYRVTCRLAALRRTVADLDLIKAKQVDFSRAVIAQDAIAMLESNRDFHMAIAEAGGNRYYCEMFSKLLNEGMRLLRLYYRTFDDRLPRQFVAEHEEMIQAISDGDAELSDRLGAQHAAQIVGQLQSMVAPMIGDRISL